MVPHFVPARFSDADGVTGGAERCVLQLARHMARLWPTSLVTFGARSREECIGGLRIQVSGDSWYIRGQRGNPFKSAVVPEVLRADVIDCHQPHIVASSTAAAAASLRGGRVVCTDPGGGGGDMSSYVSTDAWFAPHRHITRYSGRIAQHPGNPRSHVIWGGRWRSRRPAYRRRSPLRRALLTLHERADDATALGEAARAEIRHRSTWKAVVDPYLVHYRSGAFRMGDSRRAQLNVATEQER